METTKDNFYKTIKDKDLLIIVEETDSLYGTGNCDWDKLKISIKNLNNKMITLEKNHNFYRKELKKVAEEIKLLKQYLN